MDLLRLLKDEYLKILTTPWHGVDRLNEVYDYVCENWYSLQRPYAMNSEKDKEFFNLMFLIYQQFEDYIQEAPTNRSGTVDEKMFKTSSEHYYCYGCLKLLDCRALNKEKYNRLINSLNRLREYSYEVVDKIVKKIC